MSAKYWWLVQGDRIIAGAAGERVSVDTRRLNPHRELQTIVDALNALPEYIHAAESSASLVDA